VLLETISGPADLRKLSEDELAALATEIREFIVQAVSVTGGHLGSNLGAVELTLAIHRVFSSPRDIILWDTGHQAYVHKIVTGRRSTTGWKTPTPRRSCPTPTGYRRLSGGARRLVATSSR
jgi:1-deoxy-D-xylulose-5-phosphate synthase